MNNARSWNFKKGENKCTLTVGIGKNGTEIQIMVNNEKFYARTIEKGAVIFYREIDMLVDGKSRKVAGLYLDDYDDIKEYYENCKREFEEKKKQEYEQEFSDIISGRKPLEIAYHDGEYWSGYTAFGVSRDVIRHLHCGKDIGSGLFAIDNGFEDGNIEKMKEHYEKNEMKFKIEEYEKEKQKLLDGVEWKIEEHTVMDEDGKQKAYKHFIKLNGKTYVFFERSVVDFGRVINPCYEVEKGFTGGVALYEDDEWVWDVTDDDNNYKKIKMKPDEKRAFLIVKKYGKVSNGIRM